MSENDADSFKMVKWTCTMIIQIGPAHPRIDVNTAQIQETVLKNLWATIRGYQFHNYQEVETAVNKWLMQEPDFYHDIIFKLMPGG
jgi:hypothetical protein